MADYPPAKSREQVQFARAVTTTDESIVDIVKHFFKVSGSDTEIITNQQFICPLANY